MRLITIVLAILSVIASFAIARPWTPGDECPTKLNVIISSDPCSQYGEHCTDQAEFSTMDAVHAALTSCPNFTSLDLRVTGLGCSEWPSRWNFPFHPTGGEKYPQMKRLRLEGYMFDMEMYQEWKFPKWSYGLEHWISDAARWMKHGHWKRWMAWRKLPQEQQLKSNFALWFDAMDWSSIEELFIESITPEVISKLPPHLQSLQKLETTNLAFIQALPNNTLTNLTWVGPSQPHDLPTILSHQGTSLQSLEFRCPELWCPAFTEEFDFSILSNAAQNLTHVSINVPRNGTWPLESLQAIALMPRLQTLDLYMNIQSACSQAHPDDHTMAKNPEYAQERGEEYCEGEDRFQAPFLEETSALELFEYMREMKVGKALEEVTFFIGDWERPWDGPLYFPAWVEGRRAKVVCTSRVQEQTENWCVVESGGRYWEQEFAR